MLSNSAGLGPVFSLSAWSSLVLLLLELQVVGGCVFHFESKAAKVGNFSSPEFPSAYPSGADCHYTFEGEEHEGVKLAFFVFDLEPPYKQGCLTDYVDISTITLHNVKHLVGRYCGHEAPSPLLSMHPKLEMVFRTSYAIQHKGFHGTYEFVDERYVPPPTSSPVEGCGGVISGVGGVITSPGFPSFFPGNIDCLWLIRVPYSKHVYLRVQELQLHGSIASCNKAELSVYDGYSSFSHNPKRIESYCGDLKYYKNVDDRNILSHRNRVIVRFTATEPSRDKEVVGFKLVWTEVSFQEKTRCTEFTCQQSEYCLESGPGSSCTPTKLFCVDQSLVCNGIPNCSEGDNSDEEQCNSSYLAMVAAAAAASGLLVLFVALCVCRRHVMSVRKSTSQTQSLTMQLRRLEHSPSCSSRQIASSFSQPCDLLSPVAVLEVNGTPAHHHQHQHQHHQYHAAHSYDMVVTGGGGGMGGSASQQYTRYKGVPTEV